MKRRTKKFLINQPTGVNNIEFDDLDENEVSNWETDLNHPKARRFKSLRKKAHSKFSSIHLKHFHRNSKGKGFFH
jgi:hypothetical protein